MLNDQTCQCSNFEQGSTQKVIYTIHGLQLCKAIYRGLKFERGSEYPSKRWQCRAVGSHVNYAIPKTHRGHYL